MSSRPNPVEAALRGLCPRCGAKSLFAGLATFAPKCRACGLDFSAFNVGDGPAAFLTLLVGGVITALAIAVELTLEPPVLVHVLLWLPLAVIAVLGSLRVAKAALLIVEWNGGSDDKLMEES